jgi:hypothetical protein
MQANALEQKVQKKTKKTVIRHTPAPPEQLKTNVG